MALGSTLKLLRLPPVFALPISAVSYALRALIGLVIIRLFFFKNWPFSILHLNFLAQ